MKPPELRAAADMIDRLCIEGSRGSRAVPCSLCKAMSERLRGFAETMSPARNLRKDYQRVDAVAKQTVTPAPAALDAI